MAVAGKQRYVDMSNPSLAVACPRCGLQTARFLDHCRNCGYKLWPDGVVASAAFQAWRDADPSRRAASRFDLEVPVQVDNTVDFAARAHELGIHLFPSTNWPIVICTGVFFLGFAAIPFESIVRIVLLVIGLVIFLIGVGGWVLVEDVHMFPTDSPQGGHEAHH